MKTNPHSTLTIKIEYAQDLVAHHDPSIPLVTEGIILQNRFWMEELPFLGIPERKWMCPVNQDEFTTKHLRIKASEHGDAQMQTLSNEGLEILRNSLSNLHRLATSILNERGDGRIRQLGDAIASGDFLPPGSGPGTP